MRTMISGVSRRDRAGSAGAGSARRPKIHDRHGGLLATVTAAVSALAVVFPMTAGDAAVLMTPRRAVEIRLPSGTAADPVAELFGVGCIRAGACTAGGTYTDIHGHAHAMVVTSSGGRWNRATGLRLPSNAEVNPLAEANSVSCTGPGSCVAVGYYNGDTNFQGFIATESKGKWQRARLVTPPPNTAHGTDFQLNGVACSAPGACVAVGNYKDSAGHFDAMALAQSKGRWGPARELPMPANAAADPGAFILGVSCPRTGFCVVTADYNDKSGHGQVAILTESAGRWRRATELAVPSNRTLGVPAGLDSVSCTKVGSCLTLGKYTLKAGGFRSMAATESKGHWGRLIEIALRPAGAAVYGPDLNGVACQGTLSCVAVGEYQDAAHGFPPMTASFSKRKWSRALQVTLPANAAAGASEVGFFYAAACPHLGICAAVGYYTDNLGHTQAIAYSTPS